MHCTFLSVAARDTARTPLTKETVQQRKPASRATTAGPGGSGCTGGLAAEIIIIIIILAGMAVIYRGWLPQRKGADGL